MFRFPPSTSTSRMPARVDTLLTCLFVLQQAVLVLIMLILIKITNCDGVRLAATSLRSDHASWIQARWRRLMSALTSPESQGGLGSGVTPGSADLMKSNGKVWNLQRWVKVTEARSAEHLIRRESVGGILAPADGPSDWRGWMWAHAKPRTSSRRV